MAASVYPWWLVRHSTSISYVASLLAGLPKICKVLGQVCEEGSDESDFADPVSQTSSRPGSDDDRAYTFRDCCYLYTLVMLNDDSVVELMQTALMM